MDAVMDTPVVAQVDAPRRRDDTLPEHEERWPATPEVRAAVRTRYDGTASSAHELGLDFVNRNLLPYPGWRIEQIARQMGIADEKRDAIIERVRAEDAAPYKAYNRPTGKPVASIEEAIAVVNNGPATPTRQMLREDLVAIKESPTCRECGDMFEPWRRWKGRLVTTGTCHRCFTAKVKKDAPADGSSAPVVDPDETLIERKRAWADAQPQPEPLPVVEHDPEPDAALTFDDLPGNRIVFELLDLLPTTGRWSGRQRYRWLTAFTATLDLLIDDDRDDETREALG